ncbi:MAG: phosphatidylglycerophosphatase A [Candidatus Puniceispirillum sp.]
MTHQDRLPFLATLATLGPIGHLRPAPGTIGSLVALVSGYVIAGFGTGWLLLAAVLVSSVGIIAADHYGQATGRKDPGEVIIDEVAGQWLALCAAPHDMVWFVAGFILFRFFDIVKPGPVRWVEKWPGGVGVMADDIIAGMLSALCLWLASLGLASGLITRF